MLPPIQNPFADAASNAQQLVQCITHECGAAARRAATTRPCEPAVTVMQSTQDAVDALADRADRVGRRAILAAIGSLGRALGLGGVASRVRQVIGRVRQQISAAVGRIITSPARFIGRLTGAIRTGLGRFAQAAVQRPRQAIAQWLAGSLDRAGIKLPRRFSGRAIAGLATQVLGITAGRVRAKLTRLLGDRAIRGLETAVRPIATRLASTVERTLTGRLAALLGRVR